MGHNMVDDTSVTIIGAVGRLLKAASEGTLDEAERKDFEMGSMMAQLFSGCMFWALASYLVLSNSPRLKDVQAMTYEKRLDACCKLNIIVAAISAFLNFFQLTEIDNFILPSQRAELKYTVDVARPVEWILTCPLLQLSLVLMGGLKIPEVRRSIMPATAATVLLFGTATLFVPSPVHYVLYGFGVCVHSFAMYLNLKQIIEVSDGAESLLSGDSEFRKATVVLMLTWFPFPIWFMLTPEGFGLVENIVVVQMGWACLNIVSKFTMIFFIQRIKDNYWNRVKLTRELKLKALGLDVKAEVVGPWLTLLNGWLCQGEHDYSSWAIRFIRSCMRQLSVCLSGRAAR